MLKLTTAIPENGVNLYTVYRSYVVRSAITATAELFVCFGHVQ